MARQPLVLEKRGKRLIIRLLEDDSLENRLLLFMEERRILLSFVSLEQIGLTSREAEILFYTAQGKPNKEIAATLYVSPLTVKKHLEHIYRKLGVESRAKALSRALELSELLEISTR